jgi:hypothetical protein
MSDTRRLIEQVGERAPFPDDAFERMLGRRDRKQRNQRLVAAGVGIALFVAMMALALGAFERSAPVPVDQPSVDPGTVTFWGVPLEEVTANGVGLVSVNGVPIEGQISNTPEDVYLYRFSRTVSVPAGARIVVGRADLSSGWIDAWWEGSTPSERLYELDLGGTPTMPTEPGLYAVEFTRPDGPTDQYETFHLLFPIRVVAPEEMGLAFSFDPYDADQLVTVNGMRVTGAVIGRDPTTGANYEFVPDRPIRVPAGASIRVEDEGFEVGGYVAACCDDANPPEHLYGLELPDGASMPTEQGTYYVELETIGLFVSGESDTFLFPVRVMDPQT